MWPFSLLRRKVTKGSVAEFYAAAEGKAFDDLLAGTVNSVPTRPGGDLYADAFSAVLSGREDMNDRAAEMAFRATLSHFRLTERQYKELMRS